MKHIEGTFQSVRDMRIYYQAWLLEDDIKGVVLIVHGLGEHCGRYLNVVNHLVPLGFAVFGFDHIGHGKSEGTREFVEKLEDYTETLNFLLQKVKAEQPDKPVFLIGHSMGGLISCEYLLDRSEDFHGAVISGPAITIPENINKGTIAAAKLLSRLAPKLGMLQLDANDISRDPKVVQAYIDDPLVFHDKTPVRLMAEMLKAMIRVNQEMDKISLPLLLVHGSEDRLAPPIGSRNLFQRAGSEDKTLKVYEGLSHEVFNEPEHEQVLSDVAAWLEARL